MGLYDLCHLKGGTQQADTLLLLASFDRDSDEAQYHDQVYNNPEQHKSKFSHEMIAGAAAFEAERKWVNPPGGAGMDRN